jgi:hypothetical protein
MIVIRSTDGQEMSQRVTDKSVNELLQGITKTGVPVNAVLLDIDRHQPHPQHHARDDQRTGGAYESATIATALPARLKVMAGRIAQQYQQVSPETSPTEEFRRSPKIKKRPPISPGGPVFRLPTADCRLPTADFKALALHHQRHVLLRWASPLPSLPADAAVFVRIDTVRDVVGLGDQLRDERGRGRRRRRADLSARWRWLERSTRSRRRATPTRGRRESARLRGALGFRRELNAAAHRLPPASRRSPIPLPFGLTLGSSAFST